MEHHGSTKALPSSRREPVEPAAKHGAIGRLSTDEELQQAVCQALIADPDLDGAQIGVRVARSIVALEGRVTSAAARERAVQVARAQRGVAAVEADQLVAAESERARAASGGPASAQVGADGLAAGEA